MLTPDIGLDFNRIDFFIVDDTVKLGEISLSPYGGSQAKISLKVCVKTPLLFRQTSFT
ncbi:MAG: hypothetical protein VX112_01190 [Pseudomonadota bacterium]|nr:hypothetical protein [Pseudomonadota bacterium]